MARKECYRRKLKKYVYNGTVVDAINKPEAAEIFGVKNEKDYVNIKRLKG